MLYEVPNTTTGVADRYCGGCLPKECPDTVPDGLKDKYEQFVKDTLAHEDKRAKQAKQVEQSSKDSSDDIDDMFDELYENDDDDW